MPPFLQPTTLTGTFYEWLCKASLQTVISPLTLYSKFWHAILKGKVFLGFVHLPSALFYSFSFLLHVLIISRNLNHLHSRITSSLLWFWPDFSFVNICEKNHAEYHLRRWLAPSSRLVYCLSFLSSRVQFYWVIIIWFLEKSSTRDSKTNQITKSLDC